MVFGLEKILGKVSKGIGTAVAIGALALNPSYAQEKPEKVDDGFERKSWEYSVGDKEYKVGILGKDNYGNVRSFEQAMEIVRANDSPSVILAGDFSDKEVGVIKGTIDKIYAVNPRLLTELEPVLVKMKSGFVSGAIYNAFSDMDGFDGYLKRYAGNGMQSSNYGEVVDRLKKHLVDVPRNEEEYKKMMGRIDEENKKRRPEGFDLILSGIDGEGMAHTLAHEFTHLFFGETSKGYETQKKLRDHFEKDKERRYNMFIENGKSPKEAKYLSDSEGFSDMDRGISSMLYLMQRKEELNKWVDQNKKDLDAIIEFWDSVDKNGRKTIRDVLEKQENLQGRYLKTLDGLDSLGKEELRKSYEALLKEASLDWKLTERVAEAGADVIEKGKAYESNNKWRKMHFDFLETRRDMAEKRIKHVNDALKAGPELGKEKEWEERKKKMIPALKKMEKRLNEFNREINSDGFGDSGSSYEQFLIEGFLKNFTNSK